MDILLHQLSKFDWEIMGICETHWSQSGDFTVDGYKILCSSEENIHRKGVALILNKTAQNHIPKDDVSKISDTGWSINSYPGLRT